MNTRKWLVVMVAMLSTLLVACGGDAQTAPEGDAAGGEAVELSQSITIELVAIEGVESVGEALSMNYPDGWGAIEESGAINITNPADLDMSAESIESGQVLFNLQAMGMDMAGVLAGDLEGEITALAMVEAMSAFAAEGDDAPTFGEATALDIGDDAAIITGTAPEGDAVVMVRLTENALLFALAATASGESADLLPTFEAMLASVTIE